MNESNNDLLMEGISKQFPGVKALDNVSFKAQKGKVAAIVGANGAGKSTLMKVLSGFYSEYDGDIIIEGTHCKMTDPLVSKKHGIMCLYQEVDNSLIPYLTVAENIFIDELAISPKKFFFNWAEFYKRARSLLDMMRVDVNEKKMINELSLSEKQLVLIARALSTDSKFLILDEPTAPLSINEIDKLFKLVLKLKNDGVGIIYISHRLNEVLEISDTVTVMRNGRVTANLVTSETTRGKIIENMLGTSFAKEYPKVTVDIGKEIFRVENLSYKRKVNNVSFSLHEGEILGIAGLVGAGKTELSKIIFGAEPKSSGTIYYKNQKINIKSPSEAVSKKIALIPEERRKEGIMIDSDVTCNITIASLGDFSKMTFVNVSKEKEVAKKIVNDLDVQTPSIDQIVKNLSGGNQQKIAVGKWLVNDAEIYLMDEPTKGVDVGSKTEIFKLVGELARRRKGIIYFSNELEEIQGIADRVLVMYDGKIVKEMARDEMSLERMLFYCTGGFDNEQ